MKRYFDRIDKNWYVEKELRKFYFDYETQDLRNNLDNFINGLYNIEGFCDTLKLAINGDIDLVVDHLNANWNYELVSEEKYYMDEYTYLSSKVGTLENELANTKKEIEKVQSCINMLEEEK